ncbi:dienelactone hydrolase family protein [Vulcanisaeta souniana]|uniref:Carboxymethylenebutenolidase n=1 Tax=Vulcanisaeta souniana JCM 11219 TaxID=1293586 RepID=A0A830EKL0_9CREN|nr:dienelactone hydrolase family protein [Vulcanisaeta souniana]BDR91084.1 carboxymethylenebutenolidase [Vulcanisaeta souniana JCM 11219]GGI80685.1 carboxymethylenebutenolidase [Vulcanisaeta souniana JCM 11219]
MPREEYIRYRTSDGSELTAFQATPDTPYKSAVIVIHEIFGITEFIKNTTKRLAGLGYLAIAPNLYSRNASVFTEQNIAGIMRRFWSLPPERRADPKAINELMSTLSQTEREIVQELAINRETTEERMVRDIVDTHNYVKSTYRVERMGIIGFCMGGGLAFEASTRAPFDASVIYYGRNPRNINDIAKIKGAILTIYASEDPAINQGIPDLIKAVLTHKPRFEMAFYPGTYHAFATEGGPAYNEVAAKDAWERTVNFFRKHLG